MGDVVVFLKLPYSRGFTAWGGGYNSSSSSPFFAFCEHRAYSENENKNDEVYKDVHNAE